MVLTSSSRRRSRARPVPAMSRPNRRRWSGGRSNRDGNFANASKPIGGLRAMGRCTTRSDPGLRRGGRKRGLSADLESEIAQEIETLLGPQALAELDFEAVETFARRQAASGRSGPGTTAQRGHQRLCVPSMTEWCELRSELALWCKR